MQKINNSIKITSIPQLYDVLPEHERLITDVLRQIITQTLPETCREKSSFNVPYFYVRRGICIIWPASIPRGGVKDLILLGFWYGNKLVDDANYLTHGTNKQIFYRIYKSVHEIDEMAIRKLLSEAIVVDNQAVKLVFKFRLKEF